MSMQENFKVVDYIVMSITICISMSIGIFYGFVKKPRTTEEYLYGNRQMHLLPVALSLAVTFQSAVSCLGYPAEIYSYSTMIFYGQIGGILATAIQAFAIVPLLYPLKLNSAYEYLGRRFNSRSVQLLGAYIGMLQTLLYMSVVLFSPALALEAVAGIPLWVSVIVVGVVGTIYTSMGGFKSVIWTDVFQFIIMYGGLTVILILGGKEIGRFGNILDIADEGNRLIFNTSFDPRVRHTVWGLLFGTVFMNLPSCCNQSAVQRMCSMKSKRDARIAVLLNIPLNFVFSGVLLLTGLVIYSYFAKQQCDPIEAGYIDSPNQLMPHFVMIVFSDVPALAGIFIAALFSGSLSSLSSGINALATNTLQDVLVNYVEKLSQVKKTLLAKLIVFVYGILTIGLAYAMKSFTGPVTQIANTAFGACGGPYVGMFFLGAMFPQANWIGALVGGVVGIVFNVWLAVSVMLLGTPSPKSQPLTTYGCPESSTSLFNVSTVFPTFPSHSTHFQSTISHETEGVNPGHIVLYDISYVYFGLTGFLVSLVFGLLVSLIVNWCSGASNYSQTDPIYIFPWLRKLCQHQPNDTPSSHSDKFTNATSLSSECYDKSELNQMKTDQDIKEIS